MFQQAEIRREEIRLYESHKNLTWLTPTYTIIYFKPMPLLDSRTLYTPFVVAMNVISVIIGYIVLI